MPTSAAGRPGARNLITDVPGLKVGAAQDSRVRTGTTVILPDSPAIAAVDVRGGGPATRKPTRWVKTIWYRPSMR